MVHQQRALTAAGKQALGPWSLGRGCPAPSRGEIEPQPPVDGGCVPPRLSGAADGRDYKRCGGQDPKGRSKSRTLGFKVHLV